MIDYKDIGQRIRDIRRNKGLTQGELAEQLGISTSFVGHIERGGRVASLETLIAICNTLKVNPQYLLAGSLDDELTRDMPDHFSRATRRKLADFLRSAADDMDDMDDPEDDQPDESPIADALPEDDQL